MLSTIAGTLAGTGFSGDGQDAKSARFSAIDGLAVSPTGDVYIADTGNHRIRKVDAVTGVVTTVVGTGTRGVPPSGVSAMGASIDSPRTLLAGRDGSLFFFISGGGGFGDILYRLTTDARLEQVAGGVMAGAGRPLECTRSRGVEQGWS
jgi:hypothetical protein